MWPFRFAMRRKRGLPHMVAYLLSSSPRNGVELMDGVESITRGWWRPTPGSIYPLLKEMSDQGLVRKLDDGRYELTTKGRLQFEGSDRVRNRRPRTVEEVVGEMQNFVSYVEDVSVTQGQDLAPHRERIKEIARRLTALVGEDKEGAGTPSDAP